jgi:hypothetical protein
MVEAVIDTGVTTADSAPRTRQYAAMLAIAMASAAAHLGINFTPYLVGGLTDRYGFNPARMGAFATAETLAFALAMFGLASRGPRLDVRWLAIAGSVAIAVAQAGSAMLADFPLLLAGRLVTGFGYGALNTAVNLAASRTAQPARAISIAIALQVWLFVVLNVVVPEVGAWGGVSAMFLLLAAVSLVMGAGMFGLPGRPPRLDHATPTDARTADVPGPAPSLPGGWKIMLAMGLFAFGTMAIWPFMERAGHAIGLHATTFGRFQSIAMLLSSVGNFTLTWWLARGGGRGLLPMALAICGTACAVLTATGSTAVFVIALQLYNVSWYISYPLILDRAYRLDPSGRLAVRTTATWLLAQSAGSLAAGFIAEATNGYRVVGLLGLGTCLCAIAVSAMAQRQRSSGIAETLV